MPLNSSPSSRTARERLENNQEELRISNMAKTGGARSGAGRPRGSVSQRHVDLVASMMDGRKTPLEYLMEVMTDPGADEKRRDWAAEKAAAYLHPRPQPVARPIAIELPDTSTLDGIKQALARVTAAVASGEIAPSEAQSLVAVIEAQRKILDADDLLERIEALERTISAGRMRVA